MIVNATIVNVLIQIQWSLKVWDHTENLEIFFLLVLLIIKVLEFWKNDNSFKVTNQICGISFVQKVSFYILKILNKAI